MFVKYVKLFNENVILDGIRYFFKNVCNLCILQFHIGKKLNAQIEDNDFTNKIGNYLSII